MTGMNTQHLEDFVRRGRAAQAAVDATGAGSRLPEPRTPDDRMMRWFRYEHLAAPLGAIAEQFAILAQHLVLSLDPGPERTVCLRKLLEAKDAAVRAKLHPGG